MWLSNHSYTQRRRAGYTCVLCCFAGVMVLGSYLRESHHRKRSSEMGLALRRGADLNAPVQICVEYIDKALTNRHTRTFRRTSSRQIRKRRTMHILSVSVFEATSISGGFWRR